MIREKKTFVVNFLFVRYGEHLRVGFKLQNTRFFRSEADAFVGFCRQHLNVKKITSADPVGVPRCTSYVPE